MEGEGRSRESMEAALSQELKKNGEEKMGSSVEQPQLIGENVEKSIGERGDGGIGTGIDLSGSNLPVADVDLIENAGDGEDDDIKNPMDVPELLQKVLGNLYNYEDLENIRRVNRFWMENSLDLWRGEDGATLVVDWDTQDELTQALGLGRLKRSSRGESGGQVASPSQSNSSLFLYRIADKPFKRHKVLRYDFAEYFPPELPAIQNKLFYWERCGPHLTSLEIAGVSLFKDGLLLEGLKWILASCPNLVRLKFNPHRLTKEETQNAFEKNWYENTVSEDDRDDAGEEVVKPESRENTSLAQRNIPQVTTQQITAYNLRSLSIFSEWNGKKLFQDDNPELSESFFKLVPGLKELELDSLNGVRGILEALVSGSFQPIQLEKFTMNSFRFENRDLEKLLHYLEDSGAFSTIKELQLDIDMMEVLFESVVLRNVLRLVRNFVQKLNVSYHCTHNAYLRAKDNPFCELNLFGLHFPNLTSLTFKVDCEKPWVVGWFATEALFARFMVSLDFSIFARLENLQRFRFEYRPMRYNPSFPRRIIASEFVPEVCSSDESETEDCEEGDKEKEDDDDKPSYNLNLFELEGVSLDKMEEFYYEGYFSAEEILLLGKVMKNLKSFAAYFTDETFPAPFQAWPETLKKVTMINFCWWMDGVGKNVIAQHKEIYPQVEIVEFAKEEDEVS